MKSVLLDTNIILDIALAREPFVEKSAELLRKTLAAEIIPFISATTVTDIYYIVKKTAGHEKTIKFIKSFNVCKNCECREYFDFKSIEIRNKRF